jgi:hypothetical protein
VGVILSSFMFFRIPEFSGIQNKNKSGNQIRKSEFRGILYIFSELLRGTFDALHGTKDVFHYGTLVFTVTTVK